jgi:hypothetical protein
MEVLLNEIIYAVKKEGHERISHFEKMLGLTALQKPSMWLFAAASLQQLHYSNPLFGKLYSH